MTHMATMSDDQLAEALALVIWGMNLDRDAHSIAADLVPTVRELAPLVAPPVTPAGTPRPAPLTPGWWSDLHAAWNADSWASA